MPVRTPKKSIAKPATPSATSPPARSVEQPREAVEPSREAWTLVIQLFKAAKQTYLENLDLTWSQAQLLMLLDPERPVPMIEIANTLGCDASNVTGLVDRLEERGIIERRLASADRRMRMIGVTTTGKRLRSRLIDRWYDAPEPIARLPQRDIKELLRILRKASG